MHRMFCCVNKYHQYASSIYSSHFFWSAWVNFSAVNSFQSNHSSLLDMTIRYTKDITTFKVSLLVIQLISNSMVERKLFSRFSAEHSEIELFWFRNLSLNRKGAIISDKLNIQKHKNETYRFRRISGTSRRVGWIPWSPFASWWVMVVVRHVELALPSFLLAFCFKNPSLSENV